MDVPQWLLMFHSGYGCPTVVTDVPQWLLMSHSGYWCSTVVTDVQQWLLVFHLMMMAYWNSLTTDTVSLTRNP